MKSGDQNWVSVSRAIKPFAESGRPPDWFSQKVGYKGEVVETVEDVIVRRLTAERIDELKRLIKDTQEKHRKLKTEAELIQAGHLDSQIEDLWGEIVQKKKQEQDEADVKRKVTDTAYLGVAGFMPLTEACGLGGAESGLGTLLDESPQKKLLGQKATPPPSPLLSELLKKGSLLPTSPRLGDENTEALDAAAVEAALSLCEETGHALSGHWEPGPFKSPECDPSGASHLSSLAGSLEMKREVMQLRGGTSACDSQDNCPSGYPHPLGISGLPPSSSSSSCSSMMLEHSQAIGAQGVSDGEEGSASETKEGLDGDGGDEEGDGAEAYLSEAEGETELEPPASESEDGYSLHTASSSLQLHTTADSIPSSPASSQFSMCSEDQEARQAQKIWKKAIMLVWRAAANHRYANVFLQPVTDDIAPGYHSIVHRPMDLSTIKKSIETGLIRTTAEFQRDIMLMFQNAVMYNSCDHDVFHMALEMQRDVLEQIQQFLATQLIMQTSESGVSAKSLRGRESTRKQDPSDKDSVPMASPAFLLSLFDGGTRGRRCAIEADLKMKK
uniref:Bromodomain-containing protein 8 n=1 Tax=Oncorhynchus mykiss TaxID=8022 RepID=A0A8K9XA55_ONCMY